LTVPQLGIWPDNWAAFRVFYRIRTQWAVGMSGAIGLRMEAMPFALQLEQVSAEDWPDVTDGVQIMEHETLRLWREKR
jgi:hypothetical protein